MESDCKVQTQERCDTDVIQLFLFLSVCSPTLVEQSQEGYKENRGTKQEDDGGVILKKVIDKTVVKKLEKAIHF